jgi:hypothetical protein
MIFERLHVVGGSARGRPGGLPATGSPRGTTFTKASLASRYALRRRSGSRGTRSFYAAQRVR